MTDAVCDGADNTFGPKIHGCRNGTDLTLLFEQSILSLAPAICFLAYSFFRYVTLVKRERVLLSSLDSLILLKLTGVAILGCLQIALIVVYALPGGQLTTVSLPAAVLNFLATLGLAVISYQEHTRSIRPSFLLGTYLAISILLDSVQARTLWLKGTHRLIAGLSLATIGLRFVILAVESMQKRRLLQKPYSGYPADALGSIFNRGVFWWLNSLLLRGSSHVIQQKDLPQLDPRLESRNITSRMESAWQRSEKTSKYSLIWISMRVAYRPILSVIFPRICLIGFNIAQPLLIYRVIAFLDDELNQQTHFIGQALIGAALLVYLGIAVCTASYQHQTYRCITMIRGGLLGLVYNKTLCLSKSALTDQSAATLMSEDFDRIASGLEHSDVIWASPIEVGLAIYILYREIGLAFLAPVVIVVGCCASVRTLSKWAKTAQHRWMEAVQDRISSTSSFLGNIKGIRMAGISASSSAKIDHLRVHELDQSRKFRQNATIRLAVGVLPETLGPAAAFVVYGLMTEHSGEILNSAKAFSALSLMGLLSKPILNFMFAFPAFIASLSSYDRIQEYLLMEQECEDSALVGQGTSKGPSDLRKERNEDPASIQLADLGSKRASLSPETLIKMEKASFAFEPSTDLVLRDVCLQINRGGISVLIGPVGSGKSALLLALLGELILKEGRMAKQPGLGIAYCSQEPWLPNQSIRSIIQGPSSFDEAWYTEVISVCCLETDISRLPQHDSTVVGSKGIRLSGGQRQRISLARAIYSRKSLILLDDVTSGLDLATENRVIQNLLGRNGICRKYGLTVVLATHKMHLKRMADTIIEIDADSSTITTRPSDPVSGDLEIEHAETQQEVPPSDPQKDVLKEPDTKAHEVPSDTSRMVGDSSLYILYANEMGLGVAVLVILASIGFCFFSRFPNIWLEWWASAEARDPGKHTNRYIAGYAGFGISATVCFALVYWIFLVESVPRTSVSLHRRLLKTVTAAPLSTLASVDTGVILNRFSQDMSLIDMRLPGAMIQTLDGLLDAISEAILITQSSPWTGLTIPPLLFILYILQRFYLHTSRQIRYLDLEAKSPLFSSILETCDGIATIRAFHWQETFRKINLHLIDESQKPFYLMYSIQCWLTLVLNLVVMGIVVVLVVLAVELRNTSGGALGVALNNVSAVSATLAYVIQAWTSLETSIGALARLKSFESETPSEHLPQECYKPEGVWPVAGKIEFINTEISYGAGSKPVVHRVNISIPSGAKIGICGRSGSGKSSMMLALLRLNEMTKGRILIDNIDISNIPRETIRRQLAVLPQDPLILPGSIRLNLDPLQEHTDEAICSVLTDVGMMNWLSSQEVSLDSPIKKETLSSGQQQLIAFARVLLNPSPVLLLDEATSMVDVQAEATIMNLVRDRFQASTVIAVAHRLNTIFDFDVVFVMDHGVVVESGKPSELLQNPESLFKALWMKHVQDSAASVEEPLQEIS